MVMGEVVILLVDVKTRMTPDITVRSIVRPMYQENRAFNGKMVVSGRYQRLWPTSNADHTAEESGQRLGNITEKMPGWNTSTVQSEQDVMNEATTNNTKHFTTLMDLCPPRHAELTELPKTEAKIIPGCDTENGRITCVNIVGSCN